MAAYRVALAHGAKGSGYKVIIAPDGSDAWVPAQPPPDETLIRAAARAPRWKRLLEERRYRLAAEIAEAEKIGRSFVNRLLRLTLLAPDIQEAILHGRQPKGMQLKELRLAMPSWFKSYCDLLPKKRAPQAATSTEAKTPRDLARQAAARPR
jgi:hypothetical protein